MTAAARFWDAHRKSGGVSVLVFASMFTPTLARQLLSGTGPRAGGVGAQPCGWSAAGRRSHQSPSPRGALPAQERPALVVDHGARHPHRALGIEGLAPR
jgi:hypothetical protein